MKVKAYIHSLKDRERDRHVLGEAEIIKQIGANLYVAEVNGIRCTAIFNPFVGRYFVDDIYGVLEDGTQVVDRSSGMQSNEYSYIPNRLHPIGMPKKRPI